MKKADAELQTKRHFVEWFDEVYPKAYADGDWHTAKVNDFPHWLHARNPELFSFRSNNQWDDIRRWGLEMVNAQVLAWENTNV